MHRKNLLMQRDVFFLQHPTPFSHLHIDAVLLSRNMNVCKIAKKGSSIGAFSMFLVVFSINKFIPGSNKGRPFRMGKDIAEEDGKRA
jgi:hypothetical protein